jgi:hypothetical protein
VICKASEMRCLTLRDEARVAKVRSLGDKLMLVSYQLLHGGAADEYINRLLFQRRSQLSAAPSDEAIRLDVASNR